MHKRRLLYWTLGLFVALFGITLSYKYFNSAIPFVAVDITMNREEALKKAATIAQENNWGPKPFMQAALFDLDVVTRNYIELEAGGRTELQKVIDNHSYELYTWRVRHMQEDNPHQAIIFFTPEGKWYGLQETLSEDTPGNSVSSEEARTLAQKSLQQFDIDLSQFTLVESSKKEVRSKRIDHTFVYENNIKFGLAPLQLKVTVSGDHVTEIIRSVKVPQEFNRRFESIRASNNLLFSIAQGIIYIFFIFFGSLVSLFILGRKSKIYLGAPLLFAFGLIALNVLSSFNQYPLMLFNYKTNYSTTLFLIQFIIGITVSSLSIFLVYGLSLSAGTELSRRSFSANMTWRNFFNVKRAGSWHIIDLVGFGLLMSIMHVTYVILFYSYTMQHFGWWLPTDTLFNPNILSSYIPTFTPLARSLNAGVWEEFLFRAVPIGGGALLGSYFGYRRLGMWLGFITQVAVFGIAHANYPGIPGYSRLIELVAPSVMFGLSYIYFGIIPGIISHWAYDLFWMSLPLLVSQATGSNVQRIIVLLMLLSPVLYTLIARYWHDENYIEEEDTEETAHTDTHIHHKEPLLSLKTIQYIALPLLVVGVFGSFKLLQKSNEYDTLSIQPSTAINVAQEYLTSQNISLNGFKPLIVIAEKAEPAQNYVQFTDSNAAKQLKQNYHMKGLNKGTVAFDKPPRYGIRFAQFDTGSLEERAREYAVAVEGNGTVRRVMSVLPESEKRYSLSEEEARALIINHLTSLDVTPAIDSFKEVSAVMTKLPNRHDWTFTFEHEYSSDIKPRIIVKVAGDAIADIETTNLTPEKFIRLVEKDRAILQLIQAFSAILAIIILLSLYLYQPVKITTWSLIAYAIIGGITLLTLFGSFNKLPVLMGTFNTTNPWQSQLLSSISRILISLIMSVLPIAALLLIIEQRYEIRITAVNVLQLITMLSFGAGIYTAAGFLATWGSMHYIVWPPYIQDVAAYMPGASYLIRSITQAILEIALVAGIVSIFSKIHIHRWLLVLTVSILLASLMYPADFAPLLWRYVLAYVGIYALGIFLLLECILIDHPQLIIGVILTPYILDAIRMIIQPSYSGIQPFAALAILIFVLIMCFVQINKKQIKRDKFA